VEHVLKDEEEGELDEHELGRGEWDGVGGQAKVLGDRVETPDLAMVGRCKAWVSDREWMEWTNRGVVGNLLAGVRW
jgi:hypothetical protein